MIALLVVLSLSAGGWSAAAGSAPVGAHDEVAKRELRVTELLNATIMRVYRADPGCRPSGLSRARATFTDEPPSPVLLGAFAILRRPATAEERSVDVARLRDLPAEGIYRQHLRIARSADGRRSLIVVARNVHRYVPRSESCIALLRATFVRVVANEPESVQRSARRALEQVIRDEWAGPAPAPEEGFGLFDFGPAGAGGGGFGSPLRLVLAGQFGGASQFGQRGSVRSRVSTLVPDGVRTITVTFPRTESRGPGRPSKRYRRTIVRTVRVQNNVVSYTVARPADDAFPVRTVWRAQDGSVVRVVTRTR